MWKLLHYMKEYWKESVFAPLFKLLEAAFELMVPLVMAEIIDVGIQNKDNGYIIRMCLFMASLGLIGLVCSVTAQYFSAKAAVGFSKKLRHELFAHVQKLSFTELDDIGTSSVITRMTSDINQVQSGVNLFLRLFMRSPFIVIGAMIMAFTIDVKAALVFVVVIPVLCVIVFGIMLIGIPLYRRVQDRLDDVVRITRENLQGVRVLRAFCREEQEIRDFRKDNGLLIKVQMFSGRISALMNPLTYIVVNAGLIAVLYAGAYRVNAGAITCGSLVALVNYMSQILAELLKFANMIITVTRAIACGNRIESILEVPAGMEDERFEINKPADTNAHCSIKKPEAADAPCRANEPVRDPAVAFDHVSFRYRGAAADSLSDVTFTVRRGETIGIIGGTGSGKTSLVNLIPRFYDAREGSVQVDGMDVRDYSPDELRRKIGIVMQKPVLFKGTIRSNLLWGNEDASDEELMEAVRAAQAEDILKTKTQSGREDNRQDKKDGQDDAAQYSGLDAEVEQEGRNFSGGQKQRLTIARALVRHPEILILDDSSSALDFATEAGLRKAIRNFSCSCEAQDEDSDKKGDMTVFIVSQRTSSIAQVDRIIVLDDGFVAGIGTHEELLKSCDVYRETFYAQFPEEDSSREKGKRNSSADASCASSGIMEGELS